MFWACKTGYASITVNDARDKGVIDAFKKAIFYDNCPLLKMEIITQSGELWFLPIEKAKEYFSKNDVKAVGRVVYKMEQIPFYRDLW